MKSNIGKVLIVIDVQKFFLTNETKNIFKDIRTYLKKNSNNYSKVFFTIFKNNSSSPLWTISDWKDCTDSPKSDLVNI